MTHKATKTHSRESYIKRSYSEDDFSGLPSTHSYIKPTSNHPISTLVLCPAIAARQIILLNTQLSSHLLHSPFYYHPSICLGSHFLEGSGCWITGPFYSWNPFIPLHLGNMNLFFQNWSSNLTFFHRSWPDLPV